MSSTIARAWAPLRSLIAVACCAIGLMLLPSPSARAATCALAGEGDLRDTESQGGTIVSFSPLLVANATLFDGLVILDAKGQQLSPEMCHVIPPSYSLGTGQVGGPVFLIDSLPPFTVSITGTGIQVPENLSVTVVRRAETRTVTMSKATTALKGEIVIGRRIGEVTFVAAPVANTTITETHEVDSTTYRLQATNHALKGLRSVELRSVSSIARSVLRDRGRRASTWTVLLRSSNTRGRSEFRASLVSVPAGDQLIVVNATWSGASGRPTMWIDRGSNGTLDRRVPLAQQRRWDFGPLPLKVVGRGGW